MPNLRISDRLQAYNQGRDPQLIQRKYQAMQQDPFVFLRGSCHLFYEDWQRDSVLDSAPLVWCCGDLHLENFGVYKGDSRLTYFDVNDFDEAVLAPCTWDLARFLTSILVATHTAKVSESEGWMLCDRFLNSYTNALIKGKSAWIERDAAKGTVAELLAAIGKRKRKKLLADRTVMGKKQRSLIIDHKRTLPISAAQRAKVTKLMAQFADQQQQPSFFKLLDVAWRISGTGSLGIERYVLLVAGKGTPDGNYLLDLKQAQPSSLSPYLSHPQPLWQSEAARIVSIQRRVQSVEIAFLHDVEIDQQSYVLRELQPTQGFTDRVQLERWVDQLDKVAEMIVTMGEVVAWGQLRSAGRQGSAIADALIDFAHTPQWRQAVMAYAQNYSKVVKSNWQEFREWIYPAIVSNPQRLVPA